MFSFGERIKFVCECVLRSREFLGVLSLVDFSSAQRVSAQVSSALLPLDKFSCGAYFHILLYRHV